MLKLKNTISAIVVLSVFAAAQAATFEYRLTNLVNPGGTSPFPGELTGYFIPSRDDSGTVQTIEKSVLIDSLQHGDYGMVYDYSLGWGGDSTGTGPRSSIRGTFEVEVEPYPGCQLAGFVVVFNEDMTQFFVTSEVEVDVPAIGAIGVTYFNFGSQAGAIQAGAMWYYIMPVWTGDEAYVSFDAGEHGHLVNDEDAYQTVRMLSDITPPEVAVDDGWRLTGWRVGIRDILYYDGETIIVSADMVDPSSGELTLTAAYEQIVETWTVTFNLGDHGRRTGGGGLEQTVTNGSAAVIPTVAAYQGYEFTGWATASGGPVVYEVGSTITPTADMTLYAAYKLHIAVSQQTVTLGADGGSVSVAVEAGENAGDWTATASANWLTATKNGNSVRITAAANAATSTRSATIQVSTEDALYTVAITVRQSGAPYFLEVSPSQTSFPASGGSGDVTIHTNLNWWEVDGPWDNDTDDWCDWIVLSPSAYEGMGGDGSFTFTVSANTSSEPRSASIYVCGDDGSEESFTVSQAPTEDRLSLSTDSMALDWNETGPFDVEVSSSSFWTVESSDPWIMLYSYGGDDGDILAFRLEENYTGEARTGEILFHWEGDTDEESTRVLTITQYPSGVEPPFGGDIVLEPDSAVLTADENVVIFDVAQTGWLLWNVEVPWNVWECEDWLEIVELYYGPWVEGVSEQLDDSQWRSYVPHNTVIIHVSKNLTGESRTGYVYVRDDAGNEAVFTIVQHPDATPPPAPPVLSETEATVGCMAGDYFLGVSCSTEWTVDNLNLDWLTVQQTAEGIEYSVSTNASTSPRQAEIVVRGAESTEAQVFSLTQDGSAPVLSLSASEAAIGCAGAAGSIDVNCNGDWTAESTMPWVSIVCDEAASRISYTVGSNTTYVARNAQIAVSSGSLSARFAIMQAPTPPGEVEFMYSGSYGDSLGRLIGVTLNGNTSVTIPDGVQDIGEKVFEVLPVKSVAVPATVNVIGDMAFSGCTALKVVVFAGNAPEVGSSAFKGVNGCRVFIDRAAADSFELDGKDRWQGMTVVYYGNAVDTGKMEASADGGYVATAREGETLSVSNFTFEAVVDGEIFDTSAGYDVVVASGGGSAVVRLKTPAVGTSAAVEEGPDEMDRSGALVVVEESRLAAKPTASGDEEVGALPVDAVPGLYYQAAWGSDLNDLTLGAKVQAKGGNLYLGVIRQTGTSGFYKVIVSER